MTHSKTYLSCLVSLCLLLFFSCEKLDVPTPEEENPPTKNDSIETPIPVPEGVDSLTEQETLIAYVEYYGSSEDVPYSVKDVLYVVPQYLELYGATGFPGRHVGGYIVGHIPKNGRNISQTIFSAGDVETNLVIADSPDEIDYSNCIAIQLSTGSKGQKEVREGLNLSAHPENLGKFVIFYGQVIKYMGVFGLKNVSDAIIYTEE